MIQNFTDETTQRYFLAEQKEKVEAKASEFNSATVERNDNKHNIETWEKEPLGTNDHLPCCDTKVSNANCFEIARRTQQKVGTEESASVWIRKRQLNLSIICFRRTEGEFIV